MMLLGSMLATGLLVAIAVWFVQRSLINGLARYHQAFHQLATRGLGEFFLFLDPAQVWIAAVMVAGMTALLVYFLLASWLLAAFTGVAFLSVPHLGMHWFRQRRLARCDQQWPDLLMGLAGALQSGSGLQSALRYLATRAPAPLGQELSLMVREQRMGVPVAAALQGLYQRVPTEATGLIVAALVIASNSGGSLGALLEDMAITIRERLQLAGRIDTLTAQGRLQAVIMTALPVLLGFVLNFLDPDAMAPLWGTTAGWAVLVTILVLELTGIWLIRRIVAIRV